jgi:hypothetical protein
MPLSFQASLGPAARMSLESERSPQWDTRGGSTERKAVQEGASLGPYSRVRITNRSQNALDSREHKEHLETCWGLPFSQIKTRSDRASIIGKLVRRAVHRLYWDEVLCSHEHTRPLRGNDS